MRPQIRRIPSVCVLPEISAYRSLSHVTSHCCHNSRSWWPWEGPFVLLWLLVLIGSQTLQHPPDQNSLTLKRREHVPPKRRIRHPTWCKNPKDYHLSNTRHGSLETCDFSYFLTEYMSKMTSNDSVIKITVFYDVTPCMYQTTRRHSLILTAMEIWNISAVSCLLPYSSCTVIVWFTVQRMMASSV
jgi:hypothetical protein